jgi:thiol-disulfide isomerase/thioredoxin
VGRFFTGLVTFIELCADKCIPCKAMQPIMKDIAAEYAGKVQQNISGEETRLDRTLRQKTFIS